MYGSKRELFSLRPKVFKVVLKNEETKLEGSLEINFIIDQIVLDMGRPLTEVEEIMILTQVFYDFCLQEVKYYTWGNNDFYLGKFRVKDKYKEDEDEEENDKIETLIGKLLSVKSDYYDQSKRSQRVLANVKISIELIEKKRGKGDKYIYLQDLDSMGLVEVKAYHQLLSYIMDTVDEDGEVIYPNKDIVPRRLIYMYSDEEVDIPSDLTRRWIQSILD